MKLRAWKPAALLMSCFLSAGYSAAAPVNGSDWISPSTGMKFVWVEQMNIWVGKFEATNAEYRRKEPAHDSSSFEGLALNRDRQPAVLVNFEDAQAYAGWLTVQDKLPRGGPPTASRQRANG